MKIASLLIAAQVAGAQLHSAPRRQLRRDANARDNESIATPNANQGADGSEYFRHLEELSSMSMLQANTIAASSAGGGPKTLSSKSSKNPTPPLELRFGPQLSPDKVAEKFDKLTGVTITSRGLQNFDTPGFSTPLIDNFSTLGQLAFSFKEMESVCVTRCYKNPACKAVNVYDCGCEEDEEKPTIACDFFNPDLGPGAYIADVPAILANKFLDTNTNSLYIKKAGNAVFPSFDEVACDISQLTVETDIGKFSKCFYLCFSTCVAAGGDDDEECAGQCYPKCITDLELTNDFVEYILPAAGCLGSFGDEEVTTNGTEVTTNCLTCLTSNQVQGSTGTCTANDDASHIRRLCRDVCYKVPLDDETTLNLSDCEPALQAAMLCYGGSPEVRRVNRKNNTTPFACPANVG